jgi:hypothetical protein
MDLATCGMMISTRFMLREHSVCSGIIFVPRACNSIAHDLTKFAMSWDPSELYGRTTS